MTPTRLANHALKHDVQRAVEGDRDALERVVTAIEPMVYRLAIRFLGDMRQAEDARQEILIQVITRLEGYRGESAFTTWVYRVATHKLISLSRRRAPIEGLTLEAFEADLKHPPAVHQAPPPDIDRRLLRAEIRVGCTLAMLTCLDEGHRMAYILGEIMELDHRTGAEVLAISPAAYRKRLQRARDKITGLMQRACGVFDSSNACRCSQRVPIATALGRLNPEALQFAEDLETSDQYLALEAGIRALSEADRAAALYQAQPDPPPPEDMARFVHSLLASPRLLAIRQGRLDA